MGRWLLSPTQTSFAELCLDYSNHKNHRVNVHLVSLLTLILNIHPNEHSGPNHSALELVTSRVDPQLAYSQPRG